MDEITPYINVQLYKIVWKYITKCGVKRIVENDKL